MQPGLKKRKGGANGNPEDTPDDIAAIFKGITNEEGITSVETAKQYEELLEALQAHPDHWRIRPFQEYEVYRAAKSAKKASAAGPDKIGPYIWNQLVDDPVILAFLTREFNCMMRIGALPECLKQGLICPIPKTSGGYRPITLLNC